MVEIKNLVNILEYISDEGLELDYNGGQSKLTPLSFIEKISEGHYNLSVNVADVVTILPISTFLAVFNRVQSSGKYIVFK